MRMQNVKVAFALNETQNESGCRGKKAL